MQKLSELRDIIMREINQNEILQKNLIVQILSSRRLLADHCEILEDAIATLPSFHCKQSNLLSLFTTSSIITTCGLAFWLLNHNSRYLLTVTSGAVISLYAKKYVSYNKRIFLESQLKDFIKALDEFEFVFKKIQTFFNDAAMIENHAKILERYNKDDQVSIHMIFTIKRVIRALYCFVKYLEYFYQIDNDMKYLCPEADDVDNCAIMVELNHDYKDSKTYKNFFSLYAFVQSYLLLRLGFIFASNLDSAKVLLSEKLADITAKIKIQTNSMPNFLDVSKYTPQLKENIQKKIDEELAKNIPKELALIRKSTFEFTLKTLNLALQSQELEESITRLADNYQNPHKKTIDTVLNNMETINSQIALCGSEHSHLMIIINKYFNNETDEKKDKTEEKAVNEETPAEPNVIKLIGENDGPQQKDEFFYHDQTIVIEKKNDEKENLKDKIDATQEEEEELQKQRTLNKFKPVLQQLKSRIEPIEKDMKEREKKSLNEKGITMPEDIDVEKKPCLEMADQNEGSENEWANVTDRKNKRKAKRNNKYDKDREFLMSKEQFNFLNRESSAPLNIPRAKVNEKIYGEEELPNEKYIPRIDMIAILKAQDELNALPNNATNMSEEYYGDNDESNDVKEKFDKTNESNKNNEEYYGDVQENYDDAYDASNVVDSYIKKLPDDDESIYEDKSITEEKNTESEK